MSSLFNLFSTSLLLWILSSLPSSSALLTTGGVDQPDFAVDLNITNFDEVLRDTPAVFAVVEFFAHWCPACRNYKPQFEKVARLFNGANAVHPGIILMVRVDCACKINTKLCDRFSVNHYPSMYWGPASKFVGGGWNGKNEKTEIRPIDDGRTADRLLKWINTQLESLYSFEDDKYENDHLVNSTVLDPEQVCSKNTFTI
ncbi:hypothetical protein R6Q59_005427 [Mikania micrantha]